MPLEPYAIGVYGEGLGLGGVTFKFRQGVTALYGLNGAGKSRLLTALSSIVDPMRWAGHTSTPVTFVAWYKYTDSSSMWSNDDITGELRHASVRFLEALSPAAFPSVLDSPRLTDRIIASLSRMEADSEVQSYILSGPEFTSTTLSPLDSADLARHLLDQRLVGLIICEDIDCYLAVLGFLPRSMPEKFRQVFVDQTIRYMAEFQGAIEPDLYYPANELNRLEALQEPDSLIKVYDHTFLSGQDYGYDYVEAVLYQMRAKEQLGALLSDVDKAGHGHMYPEWWPDPSYVVGDFRDLRFLYPSIFVEDTKVDLERAATEFIRRQTFDPFTAEGQVSASLVEKLDKLSAEATRALRLLLEDAPALKCRLEDPNDWFYGSAVRWTAVDEWGRQFDISALSQSQARWCRFAIRWALASGFDLVLIDEPESALHARAIRHLFDGLIALADERSVPIVVATHARDVLSNPDVHLVHVQQGQHGVTARELSAPLRSIPAELGIDTADMLQLVRFFLLVEGRHDQIVLESLVGDPLSRLGAWIIPVRGARQLAATAHSEFLFDFTDARIVALVDNLRASKLVGVVESLQLLSPSDEQAIQEVLDAHLNRKVAEEGFLHGFLWRCATSQRLDRVRVHGLSKPDILHYLDCNTLTAGKFDDWSTVRSLSGNKDVKQWLAAQNVTIDDQALRRAAVTAGEVPSDFATLLELMTNWPH